MKWLIIACVLSSCFVSCAQQRSFTKEYLLGRFEPAEHPDFVPIDTSWWGGREGVFYLHKSTYQAFEKMANAAKKDGVQLRIVSATRNFKAQKRIWENKWTGKTKVHGQDLSLMKDQVARAKMILLYSSMPGTSRHHWGTDIDLNALENDFFMSGEGKKIYQWLVNHAAQYGFCQPYTDKSKGRTGYEEEQWHWSYLPLSSRLLKQYNQVITPTEINGFEGSKTALPINVIKLYVNGIGCSTDPK